VSVSPRSLSPRSTNIDSPLRLEALKGVVRKIEIVFRHDAKRSDGSQRKAVLAVKLVDSIPVHDQFALVATRQVEVVHQAVARVVGVPVALVVHARTPIIAFAQIIPSWVVHEPSRVLLAVVEGSRADTAQGDSGVAVRAGSKTAALNAWS
jgi:hypothetical protein